MSEAKGTEYKQCHYPIRQACPYDQCTNSGKAITSLTICNSEQKAVDEINGEADCSDNAGSSQQPEQAYSVLTGIFNYFNQLRPPASVLYLC